MIERVVKHHNPNALYITGNDKIKSEVSGC